MIISAGMQVTCEEASAKGFTARNLTVTSFNIRYYGRTDRPDEVPLPSERNQHIKDFIQDEIPYSDVYVFQEIMDKDELIKNVLSRDLKCISYDNDKENHQFIVMCARSKYQWKVDRSNDDNFVIEEVSLGSSGMRPAVHAILQDSKGNDLLRVVGVHLKAFPVRTDMRALQMEYIAKHLAKGDRSIPTVITGDFNTYYEDQTGLSLPDVDILHQKIRDQKLDLEVANHPSDYTYRSGQYRSKFDHFWKSKSLRSQGPVQVTGHCNDADVVAKSLTPDDFYKYVSDHCPVTLKVRAP